MKKILNYSLIMFVFLFGVVSCQQDRLGELKKNAFRVSAEVAKPSTKVTYGVDNANNTITPQWTVGDKIIGFDDKEVNFEFSISAVDPTTKKATIDVGTYIQGEATKLYAIYYPGKTIADISSKTLAVDLSAQKGSALGDSSLVLMCATAEIDPTETKLVFDNATAIVGIKRMKIDPTTTINSVKVSGLVTSGMFKVVEGTMVLEAATAIDTVEVSDITLTSDGDGIVGTSTTPALMFATLPMDNAKINISGTTAASAEYVTLTTLKTDIAAGKYYYADKVLTTDVAAIGSTTYDCLSAAFDAAGTSTIKILKDCEADATLTVASGKTVTLDLNGKTVTISGDNTQEPKVAKRIEVVEGGDLTITDNSSDVVASQGSIVAADGTKGTSNVVAIGGTLTIAGGNIISNPANSDDIDAAVYVKGGATATISGGYIRGEGSEGALTVNTAKNDAQAVKSTLNISGGKIESNGDSYYSLYVNRSDANISGGEIVLANATKSGKGAISSTNENLANGNPGVITITGGSIDSKGQYGVNADGVAVNVSAGKIKARKPYYMIGTSSSTVSGGEFINHLYGHYVFYAGANATINVTGGKAYATTTTTLTGGKGAITISNSVITNKAVISTRIASGCVNDYYEDTDTEDYGTYLYQVKETSDDVKEDIRASVVEDGINYTYYCTAAGAVQYVNNSSLPVTLTVQRDFSTTKLDFYSRDSLITLNLNGKAISKKTDKQTNLIVSSSSLTIEDSSNPSTGALNGGHCAVYADSSAVLTINGGSFTGDGSSDAGFGVIYATSTADSLIIEGGTITCSAAEEGDYRALNVACNGRMTGGKIVSKGSCIRTSYSAQFTFDGEDDDINIISDADAYNTMLIASSANSQIKVKAGHYFISGPSQPGDSVAFQNDANKVVVTGGKMNVGSNKVTAATGYKVSALAPIETFDGKTYLYKVEKDTEAEPVASVNGTNYSSLTDAYTAAMAISDSVTIKLLADATLSAPWDFNKAGDKGTCLHLNGHKITSTVNNVFTPKKALTITGNHDGDTIISNKYCIIKMTDDNSATVNINNCTIISTSTASSLGNSVLTIDATNANSARIFNIGENAKIIFGRIPLYAKYGTFNISSNAEITSTADANTSACIYVNTGGVFNISDNASLKGYNAMRSASGNSVTSVSITGGYFYASGTDGKILKYTSDYDKRFNFNGGYYNKQIEIVNGKVKGTAGGTATQLGTAAKHTHGGDELSYGYQVQ